MEYRSAIVEETGEFICWADRFTEAELDELFERCPEWRIEYLEVM